MIIVSGELHVDAEDRDNYVASCLPVIEAARAAPGCLDFHLSADLIDTTRINVYERWDTDEQLETFRGAGPDAGQQAQIRDAAVSRYRISAVEDA